MISEHGTNKKLGSFRACIIPLIDSAEENACPGVRGSQANQSQLSSGVSSQEGEPLKLMKTEERYIHGF